MTVVAVNAMVLEEGHLSGIGYYIVQLLTHFDRLRDRRPQCRVIVFCRPEAAKHFTSLPGIEVIAVVAGKGRVGRVLAEQLRLPWHLRREKVDVLLNPAFTGPLWGARRIQSRSRVR